MTRPLRYLQQRLTYANVTASLALFIALGGTGYAATRLPRDSVAGPQIVNRSILAQDLHSSTKPRTIDVRFGPGALTESLINGRPDSSAAKVTLGAQPGLYFIRVRRQKNERCLPGQLSASSVAEPQPLRLQSNFLGDVAGGSNYAIAATRPDGSPVDAAIYFPFLCVPGLGENKPR